MSARATGRAVLSLVLSFAVLAGAPTLAEDSQSPSEFRRTAAPSASLAPEEFGLSIAWDRELGSGYSNVSVADGKAVTGFTAGEVRLHRPYFEGREPVEPLEFPLGELLFINHLHAHRTGVEIHGCGVIDRSGAGYLFAGQSGAGKTTKIYLMRRSKNCRASGRSTHT